MTTLFVGQRLASTGSAKYISFQSCSQCHISLLNIVTFIYKPIDNSASILLTTEAWSCVLWLACHHTLWKADMRLSASPSPCVHSEQMSCQSPYCGQSTEYSLYSITMANDQCNEALFWLHQFSSPHLTTMSLVLFLLLPLSQGKVTILIHIETIQSLLLIS